MALSAREKQMKTKNNNNFENFIKKLNLISNLNIEELKIIEDNSEWEESSKISPMVEIDNDEN